MPDIKFTDYVDLLSRVRAVSFGAQISARFPTERGIIGATFAKRGKLLRKSYDCELEIAATRCQRLCQSRILGVGSIKNARPLLFGANVGLDQLQSAIKIIYQCPDCFFLSGGSARTKMTLHVHVRISK